MSNFNPSAACCSTPAVIGPPYQPKGQWTKSNNTKIYTSGPEKARKALFICYDIFGYSSQILQGADILADAGYRIFMPDFFDGSPAPLDWMPLDGPEEVEKMDAFCEGPGETQKTLKRIGELREGFQEMCPEIEKWGLIGYCWSGFVAPYAVGPSTPFAAVVMNHPGFPSAKIAAEVSVPLLCLCSKDEPASEYAKFKPALKFEHRFEMFPEMVHGWLSARGDLGKEGVRRDFQKGYAMVVEWFDAHL